MDRKNWQNNEVQTLKDNIQEIGVQGCADKLGRPFKSVWSKAQKLGILPGDKRWWSDEQKDIVAAKFGVVPSAELAGDIGVTVSALYHQARRMGLKSPKWWTEEELLFLEKNYHLLSCREIGEAIDKTEEAVQSAASKKGLAQKNFFPEERYCIDCGKQLANKYVDVKRCPSCAYKYRSGENSHFWKGGVSTLYKLIQRNLWAVWKKPILERDNFMCKLCGSKILLEVHHSKPLVEIRDGVMAENPNLHIDNYDERVKLAEIIVDSHVLEYGITLCQSCHRSYHAEKRSELLGTPNGEAEGNQQPSRSNVIDLVDRKVQRLMGEDSQPISPTRALRASSLKM